MLFLDSAFEDDCDEVALLDFLNDAALSLGGIIRLLEGIASHDETSREESLALIVVTEHMQKITDDLRNEAHKIERKINSSN